MEWTKVTTMRSIDSTLFYSKKWAIFLKAIISRRPNVISLLGSNTLSVGVPNVWKTKSIELRLKILNFSKDYSFSLLVNTTLLSSKPSIARKNDSCRAWADTLTSWINRRHLSKNSGYGKISISPSIRCPFKVKHHKCQVPPSPLWEPSQCKHLSDHHEHKKPTLNSQQEPVDSWDRSKTTKVQHFHLKTAPNFLSTAQSLIQATNNDYTSRGTCYRTKHPS